MSDPFSLYVQAELPRRPTLLTTAYDGFDGDPNSGGAPTIVQNAPLGTFYLRLTGNVLYQKTSATPGTWQTVGTSGVASGSAKVFTVPTPVIADTTSVQAGYAANQGSNTFTGVTNPDVPRNLQVFFAAGWDGGDVTVVGTNQFSNALSEVFTTGSNVLRVGAKIFKTITSITKGSVGASSALASVGPENTLGIVGVLADTSNALLFANNVAIGGTLDAVNQAFTPQASQVPDGVLGYALLANVTG
jgi:hypothetical protein